MLCCAERCVLLDNQSLSHTLVQARVALSSVRYASMKTILIIFIVLLVSACTSTVNKTGLMIGMEKRLSLKNSHINILWYIGSKDHYHYVAHVYGMFGSKNYRLSYEQLNIPEGEIFLLTSDSTKFKRIARIGDEWAASRKDFDTGIWELEPEGLAVSK